MKWFLGPEAYCERQVEKSALALGKDLHVMFALVLTREFGTSSDAARHFAHNQRMAIETRNPSVVTTKWVGWIAQSVEQRTENPCVGGSIPPPATTFTIANGINASVSSTRSKTSSLLTPTANKSTKVTHVWRCHSS